jgi:hypothetical protein
MRENERAGTSVPDTNYLVTRLVKQTFIKNI